MERADEGNTTIRFTSTIRNVAGKNRQSRNYRRLYDYFAIYNEALNKCYLVAADQVGLTSAALMIEGSEELSGKNTL